MKKKILGAMLALTMIVGCVTTVHAYETETRRIQGYYANGYICTAYDEQYYPYSGADLKFNERVFADLDTKGTQEKGDDEIIPGTIVSCEIFRETEGDQYPETMKIIDMNREADIVYVMTANGCKYSFKGCEDWEIGDGVSAIMHNNGSSFVIDDYIVECVYAGWSVKYNPFTDVKENDWFYKSVLWARENGIMSGFTYNTFVPNDVLTRAQCATILYRIKGSPAVDYTSVFFDVKANDWYASAVVWANKNGIVAGYTDGTFGANDAVTREQFATMLYRFGQYLKLDIDVKTESLQKFSDACSVSGYAKEPLEWAVGYGLISGRTETELCPLGNTSRAEGATIIQRMNTCWR